MDWMTVFERFGLPIGILIATALSLWRVTVFIGNRLFHEETGYVSRAINTHVGFVQTLQTTSQEQSRCLQELATNSNKQMEVIKGLDKAIRKVMIEHQRNAEEEHQHAMGRNPKIRTEFPRHEREEEEQ